MRGDAARAGTGFEKKRGTKPTRVCQRAVGPHVPVGRRGTVSGNKKIPRQKKSLLLGKFPRLTCVEILPSRFPTVSSSCPSYHPHLCNTTTPPSFCTLPFPRSWTCLRSTTCPSLASFALALGRAPFPRLALGHTHPFPRLVLGVFWDVTRRDVTSCLILGCVVPHTTLGARRHCLLFLFSGSSFSFSFLLSPIAPLLSYVHGDPSCSPLRHASPFVASPLPLSCRPAPVVSPSSSCPRPRHLVLTLAISPSLSPSRPRPCRIALSCRPHTRTRRVTGLCRLCASAASS
jgi:hypothetical protein